MRPIITIDDFSRGILLDKTLPVRDGFSACGGIDIHRDPGILQVSQKLVAETEAGSPDDITNGAYWIVRYTGNASYKYYAMAGTRIYAVSGGGGTWTKVHTNTQTTTQAGGLIVYGTDLYYISDTNIGKYDGTTWVDDWGSTIPTGAANIDSDTRFHPATIFAGKLMIGCGRYIATYDGTTLTVRALDLPTGYWIRCLEVFGNRLVIGAAKSDEAAHPLVYQYLDAKLFTWDGSSASFSESFDLNEQGIVAMISWKNVLLVFGGIYGNIYQFNGASLTKIAQIPIDTSASDNFIDILPGAVANFQGNILIGVSTGYTSVDAIASTGIYTLGRKLETLPIALTLSHIMSSGSVAKNAVYAIYPTETNAFLTSWYYKDNGTVSYGIDFIDENRRYNTGAYWESQVYQVALGSAPILIKGVEIISEPLQTSNTIVIKYKKDNAVSWSTLGTITSTNQDTMRLGTIGIGKSIQIRLEFATANDNNYSPKIHTIKIY